MKTKSLVSQLSLAALASLSVLTGRQALAYDLDIEKTLKESQVLCHYRLTSSKKPLKKTDFNSLVDLIHGKLMNEPHYGSSESVRRDATTEIFKYFNSKKIKISVDAFWSVAGDGAYTNAYKMDLERYGSIIQFSETKKEQLREIALITSNAFDEEGYLQSREYLRYDYYDRPHRVGSLLAYDEVVQKLLPEQRDRALFAAQMLKQQKILKTNELNDIHYFIALLDGMSTQFNKGVGSIRKVYSLWQELGAHGFKFDISEVTQFRKVLAKLERHESKNVSEQSFPEILFHFFTINAGMRQFENKALYKLKYLPVNGYNSPQYFRDPGLTTTQALLEDVEFVRRMFHGYSDEFEMTKSYSHARP